MEWRKAQQLPKWNSWYRCPIGTIGTSTWPVVQPSWIPDMYFFWSTPISANDLVTWVLMLHPVRHVFKGLEVSLGSTSMTTKSCELTLDGYWKFLNAPDFYSHKGWDLPMEYNCLEQLGCMQGLVIRGLGSGGQWAIGQKRKFWGELGACVSGEFYTLHSTKTFRAQFVVCEILTEREMIFMWKSLITSYSHQPDKKSYRHRCSKPRYTVASLPFQSWEWHNLHRDG